MDNLLEFFFETRIGYFILLFGTSSVINYFLSIFVPFLKRDFGQLEAGTFIMCVIFTLLKEKKE